MLSRAPHVCNKIAENRYMTTHYCFAHTRKKGLFWLSTQTQQTLTPHTLSENVYIREFNDLTIDLIRFNLAGIAILNVWFFTNVIDPIRKKRIENK